MINDFLQPWKPGQPLSSEHLNQSIDRLNNIGSTVPGDSNLTIAQGPNGTVISLANQTYKITNLFQGVIVTTGYSQQSPCTGSLNDFIDNRYWVKKVNPNQQPCEI